MISCEKKKKEIQEENFYHEDTNEGYAVTLRGVDYDEDL